MGAADLTDLSLIHISWIALATGSFSPASNQTADSPRPPRSWAIARMIWADSIPVPKAALASVLAITIVAYSSAWSGRSAVLVSVDVYKRQILGWRGRDEIIHRDDLVVLDAGER